LQKIDGQAGDVAHVSLEDVQRDVGDGLDNLAVAKSNGAGAREVSVSEFAALDDDAAREFEDGVALCGRSVSTTRVLDVPFGESDLTANERVRAQTIVAEVALGDGDRDLLADLAVEAATGNRAAEEQPADRRSESHDEIVDAQ
jgi:hypothetical protein